MKAQGKPSSCGVRPLCRSAIVHVVRNHVLYESLLCEEKRLYTHKGIQ